MDRSSPRPPGRYLAVLGLLLLTLFTTPTHTFMPYDWRMAYQGKGGVSHKAQTRQAFAECAKQLWSIETLSKTMITARDDIARANAEADDDQLHSDVHFDGENFVGSQRRIALLSGRISKDIKDGRVADARYWLGHALHTVQDFYSHTNWVEMGLTEPSKKVGRPGAENEFTGVSETLPTCSECVPHNPTLGSTACAAQCLSSGLKPLFGGVAGLLVLPAQALLKKWCVDGCLCLDCNSNLAKDLEIAPPADFESKVTSGYYGGEDKTPKIDGKCRHGGHLDYGTGPSGGALDKLSNQGINKDSMDCGWSPRSFLHKKAVEVAVKASKQYIIDLKDIHGLTEREMRLLFGIGPSLALAIDTTGSMGTVISAVRAEAIKMVDQRLGKVDEPSKYVLVPFNDPGTGPVFTTSDPEEFKARIKTLSASGGGDCPELAMTGIIQAIDALDSNANLFAFTDASAKDVAKTSEVISKAKAKDIRIYPFIFNSGCATRTGFELIATKTGGQMFGIMSNSEAVNIATVVEKNVGSNIVNVLSIEVAGWKHVQHLAEELLDKPFSLRRRDTVTYSIPVDSSMTAINFALSGGLAKLVVTRPDGSIVAATPEDNSTTKIEISSATLLSCSNPIPGFWNAAVTSDSGNFTLTVTGTSTLHFSSFDYAELRGRPGHDGFGPSTKPPPINVVSPVLAMIDGAFSSASFELRNGAGAVVEKIDMTSGSGEYGDPPSNSFMGSSTPPAHDFLIYVTGLDGKGAPYQRLIPRLFTPKVSNGTFSYNGTLPGGNGTFTTELPKYPNATATTHATTPAAHSGHYANTTGTHLSIPTGDVDKTTVIVTSWVSTCPVVTTVVSGTVTQTKTTHVLSTLPMTYTSVIPCGKCSGPNYPSSTATPGGSTVTTYYTSTISSPIVKTILEGSTTKCETSYSLYTTIISTAATPLPLHSCPTCTGPPGGSIPPSNHTNAYTTSVAKPSSNYTVAVATGDGLRVEAKTVLNILFMAVSVVFAVAVLA